MGTCFTCFEKDNRTEPGTFIRNQNASQQQRVERSILENISHPFIVRMHFAFQTPKKLYFVMDFINGGELFTHIRREGRFSENRARFYAAEIVIAIEHLHLHGIIYRDLKPENVLLDQDGHIRITDFGLSKLGIMGNKNTYTFCGTPEYLAPEIAMRKPHGKAVDWWSLGLMIYEMISGIHPFKIRNRNQAQRIKMIIEEEIEMQPTFSNEAQSLIQGLLQKKPKNRLGYNGAFEIKEHFFFAGIDWNEIASRSSIPPYRPRVSGELDLRNIDREFTRQPPEETPEQDSYLKGAMFDNFTFIGDKKFLGSSFNE